MSARRYEARKRGRRWGIVDVDSGEFVYVRPDFLRPVVDREVLHRLARELAVADRPIEAIMAHETEHNPRLPPPGRGRRSEAVRRPPAPSR